MSVSNDVYSGLSTYGRFSSIMGLVVVGLIGLVLILIGAIILRHKSRHTKSVIANIQSANCTTSNKSTSCTLNVQYTVDSKSYTATVTTNNNVYYMSDSKVEIYYNPSNPSDATFRPMSKGLGIGLIVGGLVLILLGGLNVYFTMKSKTYAAIEGGVGLAYDAKNLL